ncbi:MAG: hypothetical protein E6J01_03755 [Chloroflexi bacterium]|nr:MAG: hypothetical protein E6J01_03755 [Chloroflexota bacterium]
MRRNLVYICRLQSRPATEEEATRYAADAGFSSESRRWQTPVETPVAPDTVDAVLQDDRSYGPEGEERGGHYCFAATANGQAAYRQLQWDSTGQKLVDPG